MDLLVSETDIRTRMSLADDAEINETLLSALAAASIQIEADLDISLLQQLDLIDTFEIRSKLFWNTLPQDLAPLRLRTGFVDTESVEIRVFDTMADVMDPAKLGEIVPSKYYNIDEVRGIIKINVAYYDNCFVTVKYTAGFEDADDERIPDWLKEAIVTKVPYILTTIKPSAHTPESIVLSKSGAAQVDSILAKYRRTNIPFSFLPVMQSNVAPD